MHTSARQLGFSAKPFKHKYDAFYVRYDCIQTYTCASIVYRFLCASSVNCTAFSVYVLYACACGAGSSGTRSQPKLGRTCTPIHRQISIEIITLLCPRVSAVAHTHTISCIRMQFKRYSIKCRYCTTLRRAQLHSAMHVGTIKGKFSLK